MRKLSLDQFETFATVVELGSFSAAARRLNLTQPAVSAQMRQLERRLGLRLVERVGRRAQPTAAGSELLPHVRRIEEALAAALAMANHHATEVAGRVRLGTGATACIYLLPPALRDLRRRFPQLEIVVRTGNTPDMLKALEDNMIDVALVTLPAPGRMFEVEPVVDDEIVTVFAADAAVASPEPITATELASLPVLIYEPGGNARRIVDDWFRRAGVTLKPVMELGSVEAIKQLIAAGLGCGLLSRLALTGDEPLAVRSLSPALFRQIGLVLRRDKIPDRALKEVIAALRALRR
jgi:DNA-binding transcriptional LysR family regulator